MFSGGRDSTLAVSRLQTLGYRQTLVTVTSDHLSGLDAVKRRLGELKAILSPETEWLHIRQPHELLTDTSFYERTCLPCHHAYVVIAAAVAKTLKSEILAMGYVGYQNEWPEQTPLAVNRLTAALNRYGINLILPVYNLSSRDAAQQELTENGLSALALEQKCSRQVTNVSLPEEKLSGQIELWEKAIDASMSQLDAIEIEVLGHMKIREI